ncbi:DNA/RNA endonuclease G (NUC1) [Phreatobacter oligotrophus]|uniref:DNA/RNA endonuclease G (NUC1) n=2 Tax=Phreatobacter oligotrophus TaxID=1122261 RepID=A0A2T4YY70_9HYPH|nr:DNA/RNA endonuclease G (NUC1) [Phreatobacter oligotrophus]
MESSSTPDDFEIGDVARARAITRLGRLNEKHILHMPAPEQVDNAELAGLIAEARDCAATDDLATNRATANRIARFWTAEALRRKHADGEAGPGTQSSEMYSKIIEPARLDLRDDGSTVQPSPRGRDGLDRSASAQATALLGFRTRARQWRRANGQSAYLLEGTALSEARQFVADDRDVAALVQASDDHARSAKRKFSAIAAAISLCCLTIAALAIYQWRKADTQRARAEEQSERANYEVASSKADAREARDDLLRLGRRLSETTEKLEQAELDNAKLREQLAVQMITVRNGVTSQNMANATLPTGYRTDFLDVPSDCVTNAQKTSGGGLEMPAFRADFQAGLANGGRAIPFNNFSSLMSAVWRLPVLTASNICRSRLLGVAAANVPVATTRQVDLAEQRVQSWYDQTGFQPLRLVSPQEIAWGGAAERTSANGLAFDASAETSYSANVVPATPDAIRNWEALRLYAMAGFSPESRNVTVFSGPVIRKVSPSGVAPIYPPQAYWIVMVGVGANARPVVEAYVLPAGLASPTGLDKREASALRLLLQATTSSVAAIEQLTTLSFPSGLRTGDGERTLASTPDAPSNTAAQIVARVVDLDHPDLNTRRSATQALITALRDGGLTPPEDQGRVIDALLGLFDLPSFRQLSANARVNLALVLAAVPEATWDRDDIRRPRARARRAIVDIENAVARNDLPAMPMAMGHLANAKAKLGFELGLNRTVFIQFAGMSRVDAELMRSRLQTLGWYLPEAERTSNAAGLNEVRFAPADDQAGRQLADDIEALSPPLRREMARRPTSRVNAARPEIWISAPSTPRER